MLRRVCMRARQGSILFVTLERLDCVERGSLLNLTKLILICPMSYKNPVSLL